MQCIPCIYLSIKIKMSSDEQWTLTSGWYVPTLWFPQSIDVAQTEGSTIHCCYVTEWNRHWSDNRRGNYYCVWHLGEWNMYSQASYDLYSMIRERTWAWITPNNNPWPCPLYTECVAQEWCSMLTLMLWCSSSNSSDIVFVSSWRAMEHPIEFCTILPKYCDLR